MNRPPDEIIRGGDGFGSFDSNHNAREQRCEDRMRVDGALNATFRFNRSTHEWAVQDMSEGGVRIRQVVNGSSAIRADGSTAIENAKDDPAVPDLGSRLTVMIQTPSGRRPRTGRVAWIDDASQHIDIGVDWSTQRRDPERDGPLDMDLIKVDPVWALKIPARLAMGRQILPFAAIDGYVHVACVDASNMSALSAAERSLRCPIRAEPADPDSLKRAISRVYGDGQWGGLAAPSIDVDVAAEAAADDVVELCDEILHAAILRQASDIHVDPGAEGVHVRFRVDGQLETFRDFSASAQSGILSRFKILGSMDIAEKRAPQDGRFHFEFGSRGQGVDIRSATLPTKHGERLTLRLLALQTESLTLPRLGMSPRDLDSYRFALDRPHGLVLLTGPTGSGKSTTLYAGIRELITGKDVNVLTIEDPVEYEIPGVAQVEVDQAEKVTFSGALRSVLRHDPDIIMVGEIRDQETADVAIKASLTGHLVLSTLHTNTAPSVITRLIDMGVERYLIAATVRLAAAQRLVRRLCEKCRVPREVKALEAGILQRPDLAGEVVYDPGGCVYCANRGYVGRLGIYEMLPIRTEMSDAIADGASEGRLTELALELGMLALADDAVEKLLDGETSMREVLAAVTV